MQAAANSKTIAWPNASTKDYLQHHPDCEYVGIFDEINRPFRMSYQELTDSQLLKKMSRSDTLAFDELYKRHWRSLFTLAYYRLKDEDACMDILQELFISFWNHRDTMGEINSIKAYLSAGVKFKIANLIRHNKVRENFFTQAGHIQTNQITHSDDLEIKQLKEIIAGFTKELPEKCRQVFDLSRNEFLSNKEIAGKLRISEKTVENQITIAIKKLRVFLKRFV